MGRISNFGILFPSHPRFAHLKCIWASLWSAFAQLHETRCLVLDRVVDSNSCWSWTGARPSSPSTLRRWSRSPQRVCWQHCAKVCAVTGVPCRTNVFVPRGSVEQLHAAGPSQRSRPCLQEPQDRVIRAVRRSRPSGFALALWT